MSNRTWTIEMMWDCKHCRKRNPGMSGAERESLKCVNCGAEKTDEPWVMPDAPETAPHLEGDLDRKARAGANWSCKYCHGESRQGHDLCEICGAPRYGDKPVVKVSNPTPLKAPTPVSVPVPKVGSNPPPPPKDPARNTPVPEDPVPVVMPEPAPVDPLPGTRLVEEYTEHQSKARAAIAAQNEEDRRTLRARLGDDDDSDMLPMKSWRPNWEPETVFKIILGVGGAILFILLMVWLFTPNSTTVNVSAMHWMRDRTLEERHSYSGEGWRDQAPPLVYSWDHCESRQRGTENCHPHDCNCHDVSYECNCTGGDSYECNCQRSCSTSCSPNGNGSASCSESCSNSCSTCTTPRVCQTCSRTECDTCYDQCPVFVDWCQYHYYQWDTLQHLRNEGWGHGAVWPDLTASGPLQRLNDNEEYAVRFNDLHSERTWRRTYPFTRYEGFNIGQHWDVEWTRAGGFTILHAAH
jgi:hypothetical protein